MKASVDNEMNKTVYVSKENVDQDNRFAVGSHDILNFRKCHSPISYLSEPFARFPK